jgi:hypothetical protein
MYKELFKIEPTLTRILIATYVDIIQVNKLLVLYFQQRRETALSHDLGIMLTAISLDRDVRHDMEAAQIKINEYHISHDVSPRACW